MTMTDTTAVRSADGTRIAYFRSGTGTAIILIDPALSTHKGSMKLSAALAPRFSAISYDRRGRGASGDEQPSTADPAREIEDIAALVDAVGGRPILFGSSSGAALALEAAARLGDRVSGVVLYEPPFICDDSRPPLAPDLAARIAASVAEGDRSAAAKAFFTEAIGMPAVAVGVMRMLPLWREAKTLTPTLRYDFAVLKGTQDGRPLPADRWSGLTCADTRAGRLQESGVLPHRGCGAGRRAADRRVRVARGRPPRLAAAVARVDRGADHRSVRRMKGRVWH